MPPIRHREPYLPRADGSFRDWLNNFAAVAGQSAAALGLTPAEVETIHDVSQHYQTQYALAASPGTRTMTTVAQKNAARREAWATVRPIAMRIKHDDSIGDGLKIDLGLFPLNRSRSPIGPPRHAPILSLVGMRRGVQTLRYQDASHPSRRAKPPGALHCELLILIGDAPAPRPPRHPIGAASAADADGDAAFVHIATRHVFEVTFPPQHAGRTATCFARWSAERGLTGPWSAGLALTIV